MAYLLSLLAALLLSLVGIVLLKLSEETLRSYEEEDGQEQEAPEQNRRKKIYIAAMFVVNIGVACYMSGSKNEAILSIANALAMLSVLWACAWSDAKAYIIPNRVLLLGLVMRAVIIAAESLSTPEKLGYILISSFVASVALLIVSMLCRLISSKAIGFGDIKLLALMGLFLKTDGVWDVMLCSMVASFLFSLYLLIFKKANRQTEIPFAPLLLAGMLISII